MMLLMIINDYALIGALVTGSLISFWIDQIPLGGTKIPLYGYCSTVVFTEHNHETSILFDYMVLLFLKGAVYLCLFLFLGKILNKKEKNDDACGQGIFVREVKV